MMWSNIANEWNAFVNLGEKGKNANRNSDSNPIGGDTNDNGDADSTKSLNGGKGSGNFDHAGRPGQIGGSGKGVRAGSVRHQKYSSGESESQQVAEWEETNDPIFPDEIIVKSADQIGHIISSDSWSKAKVAYTIRDGRVLDPFRDLDPSNELDKHDIDLYRDYMKATFKIDDKELDRLLDNTRGEAKEKLQKELREKKKNSLANQNSVEDGNSHPLEIKKVENGGKGSGNFGHAGRPGMVGGSGKGALASSAMRTRSFRLGDTVTVKSKGKEYTGVLSAVTRERTSEVEIEVPGRDSLKIKVPTATLVQENGEQVIVPFYSVKMVKNVDEAGTTPEERRTEKQKAALEEVSKMVKISDKELSYLKNNCSEDSAIALRDEFKRATEDGIDLSQVSFKHNNRLSRTQGKVVYQAYTKGSKLPPLELQLSGKWVEDGEYYKQRQQKNYDSGWHTSPTIAGILRHELGHVKSAQIVLRQFDASSEQTGKRVLTSTEVSYRNEKLCQSIVKNANPGYSLWTLSHGSGKDVSNYAVRDSKYSEVVAESYSNSNFSKVTKDIAQALDKEFKMNRNSFIFKFENSIEEEELGDSLCTGYPMSEEDWDILHGGKVEEYIPEDFVESKNGRMDTNGRIHDNLGQFMAKAGFTSKPSLISAVEEVVETVETGETEGGDTSESAIIE